MNLLDGDGLALLELDAEEVELLTHLFDELAALLDGEDSDDAVLRRLRPAGYRDDPEAAAEFRSLTASGLRAERDERLAACRDDRPTVRRST